MVLQAHLQVQIKDQSLHLRIRVIVSIHLVGLPDTPDSIVMPLQEKPIQSPQSDLAVDNNVKMSAVAFIIRTVGMEMTRCGDMKRRYNDL